MLCAKTCLQFLVTVVHHTDQQPQGITDNLLYGQLSSRTVRCERVSFVVSTRAEVPLNPISLPLMLRRHVDDDREVMAGART
jgi:hypothetical protein